MSQEIYIRNPVGDLQDAFDFLQYMDRYNDTYLIFQQTKSGAIEHVGTLIHTRHLATQKCLIESVFIMRGPYGTFGCTDCSEWRTYQRGGDSNIDRRAYLAFKMLDRCTDELYQIGIDTRQFKRQFNTEWIKAFEKVGYIVLRMRMDPSNNPFGIQGEGEKSW